VFLSMTGFASKTSSIKVTKGDKISIYVEIKSINSRFFEASCKLPNVFSALEIPIINKLKTKLLRGRIFVFIKISEEEGAMSKVVPSTKLLQDYLDALNNIKKTFKLEGELTVTDVLNIPNIFSFQSIEFDSKTEKIILENVDEIIEKLIKSRNLEGIELKKDLEKRFDICTKKMMSLKKRFNSFVKEKRDALSLIQQAYQKSADEESKLKLDEIYSLLNKIDVHEEITRFESHLKNTKKIIKDMDIEKGKRLDFVLQELLRESNTILAKCSDFEISTLAVDIKVELEKVREQVQNIV